MPQPSVGRETPAKRQESNRRGPKVTLANGLRRRGNYFQADYRRWGHGQLTLRLPGSRTPITDPIVANATYQEACAEYDRRAVDAANGLVVIHPVSLHPADYVVEFMRMRTAAKKQSPAHLDTQAHYLTRIFQETSFQQFTNIQQIGRRNVAVLMVELSTMRKAHPLPFPVANLAGIPEHLHEKTREEWEEKNNRLSPATIRIMAMALSALFTHAIDLEDYKAVHPVRRHSSVPSQYKYEEAEFLEVEEAARMLTHLETEVAHWRSPYAYEMLAVLLYTGARKEEMMGLRPEDVLWSDGEIILNGTKTDGSKRRIPLWPALARILRAFFDREGLFKKSRALVFPGAPRAGKKGQTEEQRRNSMLNLLKRLARDVGISKAITHHTMRHTYASVRLQMVQNVNGKLVNVTKHTVMKEMGHASEQLLDRLYGHVLRGRLAITELDYTAACVVTHCESKPASANALLGAATLPSEGAAGGMAAA